MTAQNAATGFSGPGESIIATISHRHPSHDIHSERQHHSENRLRIVYLPINIRTLS
jgi:hypothetical protein